MNEEINNQIDDKLDEILEPLLTALKNQCLKDIKAKLKLLKEISNED